MDSIQAAGIPAPTAVATMKAASDLRQCRDSKPFEPYLAVLQCFLDAALTRTPMGRGSRLEQLQRRRARPSAGGGGTRLSWGAVPARLDSYEGSLSQRTDQCHCCTLL